MAVGCVAGCPNKCLRSQTTARRPAFSSVTHISKAIQLRARPCQAQQQRTRSLRQRTRAVLNVDQSSFEAEVVKVQTDSELIFRELYLAKFPHGRHCAGGQACSIGFLGSLVWTLQANLTFHGQAGTGDCNRRISLCAEAQLLC